ncbi:oxidoreductase [Affinibrenneria salicis]|uniref:Oxidoreductase n=1 Tax=Affinibrenneria salicis TaxID=2590031 RepID=A0A5J5FQS2_9GAMM|nr:fimbrial protein [Affinibrenneria salicis]KAA8995381.1 oxidoreductase [Affinibrenneria salicis]
MSKLTRGRRDASRRFGNRAGRPGVLFFILCLLALPLTGECGNDLTLTFSGAISYAGPADDVSIGQQIGPAWSASNLNVYMCNNSSKATARAYVSAVRPSTGLTTTISGVNYIIYDSGTPGIGLVIGVKDTNATNYSALLTTRNQWYPAPGTNTVPYNGIGGYGKVTLVKTTGHLQTGTTTLAAQNIALVQCYGTDGSFTDSAYIKIAQTQITVAATGCNVQSGANRVVNMGNVSTGTLPSVGSQSEAKSTSITLTCDTGIHVAATVSDQTNTGNISNIIGLSSDSTAKGIGIQAFYNGSSTPINLGPDNSSKGNTNQFSVADISSQGQALTFPLTFKYVRTGDMTAGTANGLVGVTFSYQ